MILFSNGCSFLTPRPKDGVKTFTTKIIAENYNMQLANLAMTQRMATSGTAQPMETMGMTKFQGGSYEASTKFPRS